MSGDGYAFVQRQRFAEQFLASLAETGVELCKACEDQVRDTILTALPALMPNDHRLTPPVCTHLPTQAAS